MFKSISKTLFTGFVTLIPVLLTIYLMYWLAVTSEQVMGGLLRLVLPASLYFPGLGMLAGLLVMFIVGLLMKAYIGQQLFAMAENVLFRVPLVKSIYGGIRDFFDFFSPKEKKLGQVVAVSYNNMEMIGFITQTDQQRLPESYRDQDKVLVYLPMSYMIGGFTVFIPRENVKPLSMSMEEAMRFALTAGITGKNSA